MLARRNYALHLLTESKQIDHTHCNRALVSASAKRKAEGLV